MNNTVKKMLEEALELLLKASVYPDPGLDSEQVEYVEQAIDALRNCLEELPV